MQKKLSKQNNSGFTLSEVLIAVAILIVLMGLAMIPITRHQRDLRQTELDAKAETLYQAAQNRLAQLSANGRLSECSAADALPLNNIPWDAQQGKYTDASLYYVTSGAKSAPDSAAAAILPKDQVDRQLWDNHWVIELDPASGSVYAVFYSERPMDYTFTGYNDLRARNNRLRAGAAVGYYGGDSVQTEVTGKLTPKMEIINKEQLLLRVVCDTPREPLHFFVTITDSLGGSTRRIELTGSEVSPSYLTYTATMVLDDLRDGMRFDQQKRFSNLHPGADLTIKVEVECDNRLVDSVTNTLTTNSLFAEVRGGDTAVVTYGRHLQNLEKASGLPSTITRAVQEQEILFADDSDEGWKTLYRSRKFTPIVNGDLTYYDSTVTVNGQTYHPAIYGLTVDTNGSAGLFAAFHGELHNIGLCGANIASSGSVGGLVGRLDGSTVIDGCRVYLDSVRDSLSAKTEKDLWLQGNITGGLVGSTDLKSLTITDSYAATVAQGVAYTGGLVGAAPGGTLTIRHSYADSYLYATGAQGLTGGLLGYCAGTADVTLTECYAAGFQDARTTAGLAGGELSGGDAIRTCYSACVRMGDDIKLTYAIARTAVTGTAEVELSRVYYLFPARTATSGATYVPYENWSGSNRSVGVAALSSAFTADTRDTFPYDLMANMGLGAYSYPRLTGLSHYGDWQADFESGALVYYEVYRDGSGAYSYGFLGANRSTLTTAGTAVGDGYGMVYHTRPTDPITVTYTLHGTERTVTLYPDYSAMDIGGGYWLVPLPDDLTQTEQVSASFYHKVQVDDATFFFNPHFACRTVESTSAPSVPTQIGVRTARHLHNLSLYYDLYRPMLERDTVFQQGRSIDYNDYLWRSYAGCAPVTVQSPIGAGTQSPFRFIYDGSGYPIAAPSFESAADGNYAGMFGLSTGTLRNIILLSGGYDRTVSLPGGLTLRTAYAGALAGRSEGSVSNCAAAGFSVVGDARQGSTLYVGGLLGSNGGAVRAASVSAPSLSANSLFATLYVGGFVGGNGGTIQRSYAMAAIGIQTINGGGVTLGGFAGENAGSLRSSYCATAMTSPEADICGFAPASGVVSGCYYLNGGTYRFSGSVHLYAYDDHSGASPVNEQSLRDLRARLTGFGAVSASNTRHHDNTLDSSGKAYPYPAVVTGSTGSRVHYGDWVTPADMGSLGLLYWEYESKATGSGYHFYSVGIEDGVYKTNSSLCTTHDDDGVVTAYGYGYYWSSGSETSPTLQTGSITVLGAEYAEAAAELHSQMSALNFVTYRTANDGLHLASGTQGSDVWALSHDGITLNYTVSPFFGCAFSLRSENAPGTDAHPYQVRSVQQLQYINWSYIDGVGSTTRNVTGYWDDYKYYPYLQYTNRRGNALQTKVMALAGDGTGGPRPILTWQQTHDLNGTGQRTTETGTANYAFHPIAGAVNNGQLNDWGNETYNLTLYNWFGGIYDGGNYYIKNVNITSHCYNVGLFGTTAGAEIKNIVLYSDNDAVIQRKTDATPASGATGPENYATSYALGGLVGIAYDYDENLKDKTKVSTISNCAIAGYTVTDNSKNRQFLGEAAIGGLVGVSSANLNRCSAVVKLNINCTHRYASETNNGAMNKAQWGNYVRVGGLVGGVRYDVSDCYTGGSITVASDLLNERILTGDSTNTSFVDRYEKTPKAVKMTQGGAEAGPDTYVYIGGIGGSGFSATFSNFSGSKDGQPTYNNCYTYMTFPAMEGTITGISLIGSIADRAGVNGGTARLTINNCYYMDSSAAISFNSLPTFYGKSTKSNGQYTYYSLATLLSTDTARMDMLRGKLSYLSKYTWNTGSSTYNINGLTALTYDQMSARTSAGGKTFVELLNGNGGSSYHWVTNMDGTLTATGKYSFPGSDAALQNQDYPFPVVLTQDTPYGTAYLHYGRWPNSTLHWSKGLLPLDMLTTPSETLLLTFAGQSKDRLPAITCDRNDVVSLSGLKLVSSDDKTTVYSVEVTGLAVGATNIVAELDGYTANTLATVISTLNISVTGLPGENFFVGDTAPLTLSASDSKGSTLSGVKWRVIPSAGSNYITASEATDDQKVTLTAVGEGEDLPRVEATYTNAAGRTFTNSLQLTVPVRMQGVLGIANTSGEPSVYWQGVMDRDGTAFTDDVPSGAPYTDRPAYAGAKLYLYSRGSAAAFDGLSVSGVTVKGGADATEYVLRPMPVSNDEDTSVLHPDVFRAENDDFRVTVGTPATDTTSAFTYRPLTVKGRSQGQITLTVTLTDAENHAFSLSIPYTLTEENTQITITFRVNGDDSLQRTIGYGETAEACKPTQEQLNALPGAQLITVTGWEPEVGDALYADTVYEAKIQMPDTTTPPQAAPVSPSGKEEPSGGDGGEDSGGSGGTSGGDSGGTGDSAASGDAPAPDTPTA